MSYITVPLPQNTFRIQNGSFALRSYFTSSSTRFQPSVPKRDGARDQLWSFNVSSVPMDRAATIQMEAWFANLAAKNWCFTVYDTFRQFPLGIGAGYQETNDEILFTDSTPANLSFASDFRILEGASSALIKTKAERGATSILVKGIDTAHSGKIVVKKGDHIGIGLPGEMNLHMATANAVCSAAGETRIEFIAKLWKPALVNDVINFVKPTARFIMVDTESGELVREPGILSRGSVSAIEVPYQESFR